jgi:hypothetical protein
LLVLRICLVNCLLRYLSSAHGAYDLELHPLVNTRLVEVVILIAWEHHD